jgi:hypothetical protein
MSEVKYLFMVGFPRSGTTLAQSIIMGDEDVYSMPETHIFTKGIRLTKFPSFISNIWTSIYIYLWVRKNYQQAKIIYSFSKKKLIKQFFLFIEKKAISEGKNIILEKTPGHLNKIDYISEVFPEARFIHVVRSYQGAIPSIIKASEKWGGDSTEVFNVRRWLSEVYLSIFLCTKKEEHMLIKYEELITKRAEVIENINKTFKLNIDYIDDDALATKAKLIIDPKETWKNNNLKGHRNPLQAEGNEDDFSKVLPCYFQYLNSLVERPTEKVCYGSMDLNYPVKT